MLFGGAVTAGGGYLQQRWSGKEAQAKEVRDRDHEREVWARDLRYQTHARFLQAFDELHRASIGYDHSRRIGQPRESKYPSPDLIWAVAHEMATLELISDPATLECARRAFEVLFDYAHAETDGTEVSPARAAYVAAFRTESRLGPLELPGGES